MEDEKVKPHIQYIFIDESGDLGKDGSKYFTIVSMSVTDIIPVRRIIKKARQRLVKKKLKQIVEIKANNSSPGIKKKVLKSLASCDCSISAIVIPKSKMSNEILDHKDKLYNHLCSLLFSHITLDTDILKIVVDKKHSNRLLREDLSHCIRSKISQRTSRITIDIRHVDSFSSLELQAVDFVAWAVNRKFTHGDSEYYDLIKEKVKNHGKEEI